TVVATVVTVVVAAMIAPAIPAAITVVTATRPPPVPRIGHRRRGERRRADQESREQRLVPHVRETTGGQGRLMARWFGLLRRARCVVSRRCAATATISHPIVATIGRRRPRRRGPRRSAARRAIRTRPGTRRSIAMTAPLPLRRPSWAGSRSARGS